MYDFNVTVKADFLYEIIGAKQVRHRTDCDGALMSTSEVKVRCASWEEVIKWIRANRDVTIKQVVEMKDMTTAAQNQARDTSDTSGYNTCNGGYGTFEGKECTECESAYELYMKSMQKVVDIHE